MVRVTAVCFDTDILSWVIRPHPPNDLVRRIGLRRLDEQLTTAVSAAELLYGVARDANERRSEQVRAMLSSFRVAPFDVAAAKIFGPLRAELEREGQRLDQADLMIASICLARDLTLVTGNVRHLARVPGLRVENWLES